MRKGQFVFAVLAAFAVWITYILASGDEEKSPVAGGGGSSQTSKPADGAVRIPFAFSPEKEKLLMPLIDEFNGDNKDVFVEGSVVSSGDAQTKIARGTLKPVAWSPASSLWGRLLNF